MKRVLYMIIFSLLATMAIAHTAHAEAKVHPNILSHIDSQESIQVIVQFNEKPGMAAENVLKGTGCLPGYRPAHLNLIAAECPGKSLEALAHAEIIKYIWEDEEFDLTLDVSAPQIDANDAWASGYNGSGVIISIVDSGVNTSHPALGNFILEQDFGTDGTTDDLCGHGTWVAGVAASTNDTYRGIAHGASFINAKAGRADCKVGASAIMAATDWSIANGAQVVSMSIGGPVSACDNSITALYVNETVAENNTPIVVAAGNGGPANETIWSPGCAENAITVGSVNDNNGMASSSSRGPTDDGRQKPDVVAPGVGIISTNADGSSFTSKSGTSFATPHVSGVIGLMFQAFGGHNWSEIKDIVKSTAVDLGHPANAQGEGLVNATAAIDETLARVPDHPGLLTYYTSTDVNKPKQRTVFADNTISDEAALLDVGADTLWIELATSPVEDETVIVTQDDENDVNVQIHTKFGLGELNELTTNTGGTTKHIDVAYDKNGQALIVYGDNDATPAYQIWDGDSYSSSGALASDDCTGTVTWIELVAEHNGTELIAMYQDSNGDYCGQVWNGTSWGNTNQFGGDTGTSTQKFAVAYEQSSGDALAVWESSSEGVIEYCTWTGSWCSNPSALEDRGRENDWIQLASHETSDRILLGAHQAHPDNDVDAIEWDGSAWGTWTEVDNKAVSDGDKILDVAYAGNTGMVAYIDFKSSVPSYATCASASACSSGTWSSTAETTSSSNNCGESADLDYVSLVMDPNSDKILLHALSQTNHYKCAQVYDGSWGTWHSNLGSGSANTATEDIAMAYDSH